MNAPYDRYGSVAVIVAETRRLAAFGQERTVIIVALPNVRSTVLQLLAASRHHAIVGQAPTNTQKTGTASHAMTSDDARENRHGTVNFQGISFPRLLVEGTVIVISILLAFGIDAWWERTRDDEIREAYLYALNDEFLAAAAEMDEQIEDHRRQLETIDTLLTHLAENADEDSIFPLMRLWGHFVYAPAHPVLEDLANSSSVEGLGIPELRFQLLRYGQAKEFLSVVADRERRLTEELIWPFLLENTDVARSPAQQLIKPRFDSGVDALYDSRYFQNLLLRKRYLVAWQLRMDEEIRSTIDRVLFQVDEAI